MKKYLNVNSLKYGWWFIFNLLVTLFVVSLMGVRGEDGIPGTNGQDGLDGQDGAYIRQILAQTFEAKPTGATRETYAEDLVDEGYLPIDSLEDFETYFVDDYFNLNLDIQGYALAYRNYVLTADIDFAEATPSQRIPQHFYIGQDEYTYYFNGIFDGAGYTISNYNFTENEEMVGFFPRVDNAIIKNVTFSNATINNTEYNNYGYAGSVVGYSEYQLDLINVTVESALVVGEGEVGGMVGYSDGPIRIINGLVEDVEVAGLESAGGLIGRTNDGDALIAYSSVQDSYINGNDLTEWNDETNFYTRAGGFIGEADDLGWLYFYRSFNSAKVSSRFSQAGGFVGEADNINRLFISQSYNTGNVESLDDYAGGFIGEVNVDFAINVQDSFNAAVVYGNDDTGGLFGMIQRDNRHPENYLTNVYSVGKVLGAENGSVGGLIGDVDNSMLFSIQNAFTVTEFSPTNVNENEFEGDVFPNNGAVVGDIEEVLFDQVYYYVDRTRSEYYMDHASSKLFDYGTVALESLETLTEEEFVFANVWNFDTIWEFNEGFDYPTLQEVEFVAPTAAETVNYGPSINAWGFVNQEEVESGISPSSLYFYYMNMYDDQDTSEEIRLQVLTSNSVFYNDDQILDMIEASDVVYTTQGYPTYGEAIEFTPESTDELFVYLLVTDSDGNQAFTYLFSYFPTVWDTIAPTLSNQAITADFNNMDPTSISVNFTTATDNVDTQEQLTYYFLVSTSTEAYLDAETAYNAYLASQYAYAGQFVPNAYGAISETFTNIPGLQINTEYYVSILVKDIAGNVSLYAYTPIQIID